MMDEMGDRKIDKGTFRWNKIQEYLKTHDYIMSVNVLDYMEISTVTANSILPTYVSEGKHYVSQLGHWVYQYINLSFC